MPYDPYSYDAERKRIDDELRRYQGFKAVGNVDKIGRLNQQRQELERQREEYDRQKQYQVAQPYVDVNSPPVFRPEDYVVGSDGIKRLKPEKQAHADAYRRSRELVQREERLRQREIDPNVYNQLNQAAQGAVPSVAELQLRQAQSQNIAQQYALANSARGGYNPMLQRTAMRQAADIGAQTSQQAALLRAQEQAAARQALAQYSLGQAGITEGSAQAAAGNTLQRDLAQSQANMSLDQQRQALYIFEKQLQAAKDAQERSFWENMIGGLLQGGAGLGAAAIMKPATPVLASDRRLKRKVRRTREGEIKSFLRSIGAYRYEYKDKAIGDGERFGVMAQDLEKSRVGRSLVRETPAGKSVDVAAGLGVALAAQSELNRRLLKLEGAKR